jgi:hypothetical protein
MVARLSPQRPHRTNRISPLNNSLHVSTLASRGIAASHSQTHENRANPPHGCHRLTHRLRLREPRPMGPQTPQLRGQKSCRVLTVVSGRSVSLDRGIIIARDFRGHQSLKLAFNRLPSGHSLASESALQVEYRRDLSPSTLEHRLAGLMLNYPGETINHSDRAV